MEPENLKVSRPHIDAAELAAQMRNATERPRVPQEVQTSQSLTGKPAAEDLDGRYQPARLTLEPRFVAAKDDRYHVANLFRFTGTEFVDAAYRAILKREPDAAGVRYYLENLEAGRLDRLDVILGLLSSEEGKRKKVHIDGLTGPLRLRRVTRLPVIGGWLRYVIDFLRAPILIRRIEQMTAIADARNQQIANHANKINGDIAVALTGVSQAANQRDTETQQRFSTVRNELTKLVGESAAATKTELREEVIHNAEAFRQELASFNTAFAENVRGTESRIEELSAEIESAVDGVRQEFQGLSNQTQRLRQEIVIDRARLALLEQLVKGTPVDFDAKPKLVDEPAANLETLYAELEDNFRGDRDTLKQSLRFYLPYVQSLSKSDLDVIDLGCGRGEWLEVLSASGVKAIGVDNNRVMIDSCIERSLAVVESDGLAYLRGQPANSVRAVTAFHLIEHLPTEELIALLDEIMRTLQPGGAVIFETPNPDNLFVASNYFYYDPTHRHPLPSRLTKFLVASRGFTRAKIINLHECAEGRFTGSDEVSVRLNELFYGPMDYAIVAWKHDQ